MALVGGALLRMYRRHDKLRRSVESISQSRSPVCDKTGSADGIVPFRASRTRELWTFTLLEIFGHPSCFVNSVSRASSFGEPNFPLENPWIKRWVESGGRRKAENMSPVVVCAEIMAACCIYVAAYQLGKFMASEVHRRK